MTTATIAPRRPAHTREQIHAPAPVQSPAAAPTDAPPTSARSSSSTPAPRTRHAFDDSDLPPWTAPAHPAPLPASPNPNSNPAAPHAATASLAEPITPMQRWAHDLVLEMIRAQLPLEALAAQLGIPFSTLITYLHLPEVQTEINAYEELLTIRARLLGHTARPVSLRKLLDILESPAPRLTHRDPEADQRTLHRHAELIRRTATTITRESRALAPKVALAPKPTPAPKPASVPQAIVTPRRVPLVPVEPATPGETEPVPSVTTSTRVACLGEDHACADDSSNAADLRVDSHGCEVGGAAMPPEAPGHGSLGGTALQSGVAEPAPTPATSTDPHSPSLSPSAPTHADSSPPRSSAFNNSSSPLRDSASSAFTSRSRRTRDHPAPAA